MKTDPTKTSVVIIAHPELLVAPELLLWLLDCGFPRRNILISRGNPRDQAAAFNWAVARSLTMPVEACLFADNDIRPDRRLTEPMLEMPYDFTCARTDNENGLNGWRADDAFHTGIWIARRSALVQVRAPWFAFKTSPDGSEIRGCVCDHFAERAKAAGCSIGNAGWAMHYPRAQSKLPECVVMK